LENQTGFTYQTHTHPTPPRTQTAAKTRRRRKEEPQRRTHENQPRGAENRVEANDKIETSKKTSKR
jgi:hypothetical protein